MTNDTKSADDGGRQRQVNQDVSQSAADLQADLSAPKQQISQTYQQEHLQDLIHQDRDGAHPLSLRSRNLCQIVNSIYSTVSFLKKQEDVS